MPLLRIQTNVEKPHRLFQKGTELVARELNKPVQYIQVIVQTGLAQSFAGTHEPNAFGELRSLGLSANKARSLSRALATLLQEELQIRPDRVFINFADVDAEMWGWNGDTFR